MKYLLIFLITFNVGALSLSEIDNLNVSNSLSTLLQRLGKSCSLIDIEGFYTIDNLNCGGGVPTIPELNAEFTIYKAELVAEEEARLAEEARINNIKTRLANLPRKKSMMRTVLGVPNPDAWFRDNISSMNPVEMEAKIVQIEALTSAVDAEIASETAEKATVSGARLRMETADCASLTNLIIKDMCRILKRR